MSKNVIPNAALQDLQLAAAVVAISIVGGFAVYWSVQIADVLEMLELAYG